MENEALKARIESWINRANDNYDYWVELLDQAPHNLRYNKRVEYYAGQLIAYKDILRLLA